MAKLIFVSPEDTRLRPLWVRLGACLLIAAAMALPVEATVIDFEAQAAARGGNPTGIPDAPLTIGIATFTGGELLNNEVGLNADHTGVYASEGLFGSGETNPVVITFSSPVSAFAVLVVSADDLEDYTVSDNLGDSVTLPLSSAGGPGAVIFSLAGAGLTSVDITSSDANAWNFAIDNVTFTPATSTPEPQYLFVLAAGLGGLALLRKSKRRIRS